MRFRSLFRLGYSVTSRMSGDRGNSSAVKPSSIATQYQEQLFEHAAKGNVDEVEVLLKAAVDIDAKNDRGWTALMFASRNGQVPVIKTLLEKGCNVNILNSSGQTAMDIANFWNQSDVSLALSEKAVPTQETECRNYYSMNPLNRASDKRKDPEWIDKAMRKDNTKFILFSKLNPFLIEETDPKTKKSRYVLGLFSYNQLAAHIAKKPLVVFLGLETWDPDSAAWFAVDVSEVDEEEFKSIQEGHFAVAFPTTMQMEERHAGIFAEARSILTWHDRYSFCSTCGSSTSAQEAGYKRTCDNMQCRSRNGIHNTCYPRVDPSLIMLVVSPDGGRCLLGRKKTFPPKMYSCLAGFMEPGECIEDTCRREVEEESGIQVGRVEYHSSQPWPFPAVLMLGCITHAKTDTIKLSNDDELEDARWFTRPEIVQILARKHPEGFFIPPKQAIAHNLIKSWVSRTSNL